MARKRLPSAALSARSSASGSAAVSRAISAGVATRATAVSAPSVASSQPSTALASAGAPCPRSSAATRAGTITAWTLPAANSSNRMFGTRLAVWYRSPSAVVPSTAVTTTMRAKPLILETRVSEAMVAVYRPSASSRWDRLATPAALRLCPR